MKKLILVFFTVTIITNLSAQNNKQTIDLNVNKSYSRSYHSQMKQGVYDNESGKITVVEVGGSGFVSLRVLQGRCDKTMEEHAGRNQLEYKFISETQRRMSVGVFPKVSRTYQILNSDGSTLITKDMAIEKIKELNELLKMDIITKEEYDTAAKKYKEILLKD
tara:strand:- start:143 stop:631 length:489 start_codon:yes stop_codon:yes gene_type:complete